MNDVATARTLRAFTNYVEPQCDGQITNADDQRTEEEEIIHVPENFREFRITENIVEPRCMRDSFCQKLSNSLCPLLAKSRHFLNDRMKVARPC